MIRKEHLTKEITIPLTLLVPIFALMIVILQLQATVDSLSTKVESLQSEITEVEAEIADMREESQQPNTGGAEERIIDSDYAPEVDTDYTFPLASTDIRLTSPYGIRRSPFVEGEESYHLGVDMIGTWRAQVVAIADGVVTEHWPVPGTPHPNGGEFRGHDIYGGMIKIRHDDGTESLYAHLSRSRVHEGMKVKTGQVIGRVGDTGKSKGQHLHFELIIDGKHVNPLQYISMVTDEEEKEDEQKEQPEPQEQLSARYQR